MSAHWSTSHVFLAQLDGRSYRCSPILDDTAFDHLMDAMSWRMPYHLRAFHTRDPKWAEENPVLKALPELPVGIDSILTAQLPQPMRLKDKRRRQTLAVRRKCGDYVLADTEDGYGRLYRVDGTTSSLITRLEGVPITLQEASAYIDQHHRHNAGPKFHKYSVCLRVPGEPEPVGIAVAGIPKARHQMDGETLEINRCCADPRYADVCSCLYARADPHWARAGVSPFSDLYAPGGEWEQSPGSGFLAGRRYQSVCQWLGQSLPAQKHRPVSLRRKNPLGILCLIK